MKENDFEKQVQQKMDELKIHPSGAVWQKIKGQIKKEKRRRWILFFIPVVLIGILYSGYILLNRDNSTHEDQQQLTKNLIKKNDLNENPKTSFDSVKTNQSITENNKPFTQPSITKRNHKQKLKTQGKLKLTTAYNIDKSLAKDIPPGKKESDTTQKIVENGSLSSNIKNPEKENILTGKESQPDSITNLKDETATQAKVNLIKEEQKKNNEDIKDTLQKNIKTANKYLWNWGISFSGGMSAMANGLFGSPDKNSASAQFSSALPGTSRAGITPALIKSSIAFVTGLYAEKFISKKITFNTGLNYKLFSTTNTTGTDSANYFRATSNVNTYHNFYHYIELPVGIKFQIANSKKIKLNWNIGASISQLTSSNALQFNNASGLYYHDNSLFNKTQFGFNTGLEIELLSKQNRSLLIGPYLNYGISKIASEGYNKHQFVFTGLRFQYFFGKK